MPVPSPAASGATLSVVVIIRHPAQSEDAVLAALAGQDGIDTCEVLLIDGRQNGTADTGAHARPWLRRIPAPGANMPRLKAIGVGAAAGDMIAFLEPLAVPGPDWLSRVRAALVAHPGAAIGGGVEFDGPPGPANLAAFAFEYGAFTAENIAAGRVRDLAANNMVLPRAALLDLCADILDAEGLNKPFCQERLGRGGVAIVLVPDMPVKMRPQHRLGSLLVSRFFYARCFGGTRAALAGARRRWLYRLGAPAVPFLLLRRHSRALRHAPAGKRSPAVYLALAGLCLAWAAGEAAGSWTGSGDACRRLY